MTKKRAPKNSHIVFHGTEPNYEGVEITPEAYASELSTGLNYYSTISLTDKREYFVKWAKEQGKTSSQISAIPTDYLFTISSLCRMIQRSFPLNKKDSDWMVDKLDSLLADHKKEDVIVDKKEEELKQIYKNEAVDKIIGSVMDVYDVVIDEQMTNSKQLKVASADCSKLNVGQLNSVVQYYENQLSELKLVYNKADKELMEGYAGIPRIRLKHMMQLYVAIINDLKRGQLMNKAKRPTPVRKKKVKTSDQLTSKVKYMKVSDEYGVMSIDPAKIIGAKILYLFNTKYRKIQKYTSETGFAIKGTTLQDFDKDESYQKTLRKPKDFFSEFVKAPRVRSSKLVDGINSKESKVTGRINDLTIILKVY